MAIHVNRRLRYWGLWGISTRWAGSNKKGLSSNVQDYWDEYYQNVGTQGDDLDSLVSKARDKGINIVSGPQAAFDPMTGNIELASNSKIWEFFEEFLHKKVAQGWKKDKIASFTQQLRKVKDYKGYKSVKAPAVAAEEITVKQWLLRHATLVGVGEAEKILLQNQINQLRQYGTGRGY
ncbi:hypothetical protein CAL7716_069480 [Calothrix sp. PCC 7716]|nr:hypothetical protein CAL7716_069480 [Calothrix sp. PCC 7716]